MPQSGVKENTVQKTLEGAILHQSQQQPKIVRETIFKTYNFCKSNKLIN